LTTELRVFGRDGRAGGSDMAVEATLALEVAVGNVAVVEEGIAVLAMKHQHGDRLPLGMCYFYLRRRLFPTVSAAKLCSS
jgi:hypothetical protein